MSSRFSGDRLLCTVGLGVVAAATATVVKTKAEQVLQPLAERLIAPAPAQRVAIGADPAGHPENMPPSELADRAVHAATGDTLSDQQRVTASVVLHWAMGLGFGLCYTVAARRLPGLRAGHGAAAGAALFTATHASTLPALGMQHPPWAMPTAWWCWEGGSHVIYGLVLDTSLRALENVTSRD